MRSPRAQHTTAAPTLDSKSVRGRRRACLPPASLTRRIGCLCRVRRADPLDTVRRRQQALGTSSPLGRLGQLDVLKALGQVARSEGFMGLFKGLSLNLVKNPIATAVSFTVNDLVKEVLKKKRPVDKFAA